MRAHTEKSITKLLDERQEKKRKYIKKNVETKFSSIYAYK